ncbi:MAG: nuclear transport factor 2 family protein [Saprospiraceae bacterium]|nr:nuclear transport factor 2 family protein [Saprospiraceae bacterium]
MTRKTLVDQWFDTWESGNFHDLPITDEFRHTSPFGTVEGKEAYTELVEANKEKFLGHKFERQDGIYEDHHACVRYTAIQGDFEIDVSEWYYFKDGLINEIIAYYHIGDIREDRQLEGQ